jgi:membrane-associated phospholipid phosphatase
MIWARPRPYVVFSGEEFQAWYLGFNLTLNNAYKSFPSGHSAVASSLIALNTLKLEIKTKYFGIMNLIISFYIGLVMISRMVRGDHYLSDVVFGGMISMTIFTLLKNDQKKRDR